MKRSRNLLLSTKAQYMNDKARTLVDVIGAPIDALDWPQTITRIYGWAAAQESRVVCICNAHSVVTARQDLNFDDVIRNADMATPDGAPVAWLMKRLGAVNQARINGPDLMWKYCAHAEKTGESMYLYGASDATLEALLKALKSSFPKLHIVGAYSPPFRALTREEDDAIIQEINNSGAGVVWVSLGCPKQEKWMQEHRGKINAVMVGVGAAFDYHAGTIKRAPLWMQRHGLEWLHRLMSEPRRLWKRYLITNSLFILYAARQLLANAFTMNKSQV